MKKILGLLASIAVISNPLNAIAFSDIEIYSGFDNQVIGKITTDTTDYLNICGNGEGGSSYSTFGIYSIHGINGSKVSAWGAYNPYSQYPPYFYFKGYKLYITTNNYLSDTIHPDILKLKICH